MVRRALGTDVGSSQDAIQVFQEKGLYPRSCVLRSKLDLNPVARPLDSAALHCGRQDTLEQLQINF